ncbi:MAG: hypothetical protein H7Y17_16050 [Chlorobia bacterium]|nr:hypothetical protein [Fimbriimonadaceae bacterium]
MLKSVSNSKLFFVALGVTFALAGVRVYAGPAQTDLQSTNNHLANIARSLDRIQRDGIKIEQSYNNTFKVKLEK